MTKKSKTTEVVEYVEVFDELGEETYESGTIYDEEGNAVGVFIA